MTTLRQIERLWTAKRFRQLYRELSHARLEAAFGLEADLARAVPLAALGMIRLDELDQAHTDFYRKLLNVLLVGQEADGGWGDPITTAVCVRALCCGRGEGDAVDRGLAYLASIQKDEGTWPREPWRRMPADAVASAFVLLQLGTDASFREAVRFDDAVAWFSTHAAELDSHARALWSRTAARCHTAPRLATLLAWT